MLYIIEIAGADEALVFDAFVLFRLLATKFSFLQLRIGGHSLRFVAAGEFEHG